MHTPRLPAPSFLRTRFFGPRARRAAMATAAVAIGAAAHAQPVGGDGFAAGSAVAVIVKVPRPWYAPRFVITGKMRDTIPQYQALPGLAFKAYSFAQADGAFGGVYLWKDLASARAWFAPAWFERVQRDRGVRGEVRFFEVAAAIDTTPGGTPVDADSPSVTTLALGPLPAGTDRATWARQAAPALEQARQLPGLLRRYAVATDDGRIGHVSLWRDADHARRGLVDAAGLAVEWFDTPILLPSTLAENQPRTPGL